MVLFDLLFLKNAESLFFVNNQHPQSLKLQVAGEQRMGTDDHIHFTGLHLFSQPAAFGE